MTTSTYARKTFTHIRECTCKTATHAASYTCKHTHARRMHARHMHARRMHTRERAHASRPRMRYRKTASMRKRTHARRTHTHTRAHSRRPHTQYPKQAFTHERTHAITDKVRRCNSSVMATLGCVASTHTAVLCCGATFVIDVANGQ